MTKLFRKITKYTIILGVIAFVINMIFNNAIGYLEIERINGVLIYRYNFFKYMENLRNSFQGTKALTLTLPTRQWQSGGIEVMANNMAVILNFIILPINIILWPLRLMAYLLRGILALIGLQVIPPITHNLDWLVNIINTLIEFIQIPYV